MNEKMVRERIDLNLKQEDVLDQWWSTHSKGLREAVEQYRLWLSQELRKAHAQIARLTEERDILIRETLKLKSMIAQMREILGERR